MPAARRRRAIRLVAAIVVSAISAWIIVCTWAVVFPVEDSPHRVDAIVVLGGRGGNAVIDAGLALARDGVSDRVVLSDAFGGNTRPARLCGSSSTITVDCFTPDPSDTRGEARAVRAMADREGWDSILVVTSSYHVTRARVIFDRCLPGAVRMHGVGADLDLSGWTYQYLYQSAAFAKVLVEPSC